MITLRDYQIEAVEQIMSSKGKLIKLPAGTGKSHILYECIKRVQGRILIIAPRYVLQQHAPEIAKITSEFDLYTYNYLALHPDFFLKKQYSLICLDESHNIKNFRSKTAKAACLLSKMNPNAIKICLTATPYRENAGEVYSQIYFVNPNTDLGDKKRFVSEFERNELCGCYWKKIYINKNLLLSIAAKDVYTKQVPMPQQVVKDIELDMPSELLEYYTKAKKEGWITYQETPYFFTSALWVKLQQISAGFVCQTMDETPQLITNHKWKEIKDIADSLNDQVIIWSSMRFEIEQLSKLIPEAGVVIGGKKCDDVIYKFKAGQLRILIANPKCIGAGVSLECCHYQIICSCSYSDFDYYQLTKRTNRINQKHQEVIYRVYYRNTIQERIYKVIKNKEMSDEEFMRVLLMKEIKNE